MKGINFRVFLRSFLLEVLWNFEKKQNVGFFFCIKPVLDRLYSDDEDKKAALSRHLEIAGTTPGMGPLAVGITARLEQGLAGTEVISYKNLVLSALAANGDRFFWTHLKPLASTWACVLSLLFFGNAYGSAALLVIYDSANVLIRWMGFQRGWTQGLPFLQKLRSPKVEITVQIMRAFIVFGAGFLVALLVLASAGCVDFSTVRFPAVPCAMTSAMVLLGSAGFLLLKTGYSLTMLVYVAICLVLCLYILMRVGSALI